MEDLSYHGSFNARWLSPEEVALKFIPVPQFQRLVHSGHSVLLGPRGCGKTTLLKMLTAPAINIWEKRKRKAYESNPFEYPKFEAIYIPSDVRWLYELKELPNEPILDSHKALLVQRVMVTISVLNALLESIGSANYITDDDKTRLSKEIIDAFNLKSTVPRFFDIKKTLSKTVHTIRGALNYRDSSSIDHVLKEISPLFFGHALDTPLVVCTLILDLFGNKLPFDKWALCYDELEIAPDWLRNELFESLRSVNQNCFLKLTCTPLLPSGLRSAPESVDDFKPIRLWFSHMKDANTFCENLTHSFLQSCFSNIKVTPDKFFSFTNISEKENPEEEIHTYDRNSAIYIAMKELVKVDESFKEKLFYHGINPNDPYTDSIKLRDSFFRKIKPIVLIRHAFFKDEGLRSRKAVIIYSGKQAIYAMCEANPRWLLGLLNDMYDKWLSHPRYDNEGVPCLSQNDQAKALNASARKFQALLSATASPDFTTRQGNKSLLQFINVIGEFFKNEILGKQIKLDPFGSFTVDHDATNERTIEKALELGAIVYVGKSDEEIPRQIKGSRFRLSYMLSPIYRLPFRNYPSLSLHGIYRKRIDSDKQYSLLD
jgi:hypothetical protein